MFVRCGRARAGRGPPKYLGGRPPTSAWCFWPARLTGWKGQKVLIEAAARLRDAGVPIAAYILAGDPQGRDSYVRDLDGLIGGAE